MLYSGMREILLLAAALAGTALADQRVPGTSVSYKVQKTGGQNTSMVFFDAAGDPSGKTYLAFKCHGKGSYTMSLYSRDVLATSETDVLLMVKQGKTLASGPGYVRKDKQTGKFSVWEAEYADVSAGLYKSLIDANGPLAVTVMREGGNLVPVSYQFDSRGLTAGMKAVSACW